MGVAALVRAKKPVKMPVEVLSLTRICAERRRPTAPEHHRRCLHLVAALTTAYPRRGAVTHSRGATRSDPARTVVAGCGPFAWCSHAHRPEADSQGRVESSNTVAQAAPKSS